MKALRYRSPEWERIATLADEWRQEAARFVDGPVTYVPDADKHLGVIAFDLTCSCDEHRIIDASRYSTSHTRWTFTKARANSG